MAKQKKSDKSDKNTSVNMGNYPSLGSFELTATPVVDVL